MYKSKILHFAKEDIREAANWYEERQTGLGKRFTGQVREKVSFIKKTPKLAVSDMTMLEQRF